MSYILPNLNSAWDVDKTILNEDKKLLIIRFGNEDSLECLTTDDMLLKVQKKIQKFATIYLVDNKKVNEFNELYELYDPCTIMFFYRNKRMMIDLGTGDNNKINWEFSNQQEFIDIVEIIYRGAKKGKGLVKSIKDYSSKNKLK